ncbi:hypothetical protein MTO96_024796 [Rhipicephalus appendiculatus]
MSRLSAFSRILHATSILTSAFLIAQASSYGINRPGCGRSEVLGRVINGSVASKLHVPWVVHVVGTKHKRAQFCGGSIITRDAILTAAHCVVSKKFIFKPIMVYYNTTIVRSGPRIRVQSVVVHENFKNVFWGYDIALLKLAKPIPRFDRFVRPVCLPQRREKTRKGPMLLAGYGRPLYKKVGKRLLYYVTQAQSDAACTRNLGFEWGMFRMMKKHLLICTKHPRAMMYKGDSGSPVTAYSLRGRSTQYGIASFVRSNNAGYAPTVSTRVSMFIDWIEWALQMTHGRRKRC